jgi:uncharacterized membrane protein
MPGWVCWILISVFMLDASTQLLQWRESKNWLRMVTGVGFVPSALTLLWGKLIGA